jgi:hypothetical protein
MIALKDIQQKVVDLIKAHATFATEAVLKDDGKQQKDEQTALNAAGHAVTVLPLLDGDLVDQGKDEAIVRVGVAVRVAINPEKATKDIYALITDAKGAVIGYDGGTVKNPNNRFKLAERTMTLDPTDPGLLAYILFFDKLATF